MALQRNKTAAIPPDAVILSENEALDYQTKLMNNWKDPKDVFAFKYGTLILANATVFTGAYLTNFYRKKFKLMNYGKLSSFFPVCMAPAALSALFHQQYVIRDIALLKQDVCPVCIELRSAVIQGVTGCLFPLLLAPLLSLSLVHKYLTYDVPPIKEPLKVLRMLGEKTKPIKNILVAIFIGQALLGSVVAYFEADSVYRVSAKLQDVAKKMEQM